MVCESRWPLIPWPISGHSLRTVQFIQKYTYEFFSKLAALVFKNFHSNSYELKMSQLRIWEFSIFFLTVSLVLVTVIKIWAELKRLSGSRDMISVIFDEKKVKT